jgi:tryptophanyl-tRNA synthetase
MISSKFNEDVNFTRGQVDIKELNAFMNEKKRKIEKELTKYDVDKDTQAKSQKVQHLSSMAQYLPLFTKKIKDPKAIKNQRATKDLDYTRNKEQLAELQQQALQAEQSLALAKA